MNIEDIIKDMINKGEDCEAAKHTEKDFPEFMEGVLKEIFGDQVSFKEIKHVDDGKDDINIKIKVKEPEQEVDETDPFKVADLMLDEDDKEQILHVARTIAQKHKKEMPRKASYLLLAAFLSKKSDSLPFEDEKPLTEPLDEPQDDIKARTADKFNKWAKELPDEEFKAMAEILKDLANNNEK